MLKHLEMYVTLNNIIGEKRIDLTYPIEILTRVRRLQLLVCLEISGYWLELTQGEN